MFGEGDDGVGETVYELVVGVEVDAGWEFGFWGGWLLRVVVVSPWCRDGRRFRLVIFLFFPFSLPAFALQY